ncbi:MAG: ATP-binding protein [Planctomycetota bacterium]|jgi:two-component system NtrC family sensor kinase
MSEEDERRKKRPLTSRLDFRLAVWLCVGAALILAAAGTWNIHTQRDHMTNLVKLSAERSVEIIRRSTRDAMLENRREQVHRIFETIGAQQGVERIHLVDREGRVRSSTKPQEVGEVWDRGEEICLACHEQSPPREGLRCADRSRIYSKRSGTRVLSVTAPIRNEPDCATAACHAHPPAQQVLGVLDVELSLGAVDEQLAASERQMGFALLVTVGTVLLLAGYLVWRMVIRPVRQLTRGTLRVAAGCLSTKMPVTSSDELGELAVSWNAMVDELERTRKELEEWSTTLEKRVQEKTAALESAHEKVLLSAKMASLGKLAAAVAHEINNPLAGINTFARLLGKKLDRKDPTAEDTEMGRVLELVASEAARCGGIVRNLLLFSRVPGVRFSPEDLGQILDRCALLVKHQAELQEVIIRVEQAPGLPRVVCDVSQIQQLLLALAMNAIEAMPDGGTLTLAVRPAGPEEVALSVADTGCGIDPEDRDHIFEPFYTKKEDGKGVGLGLAVVYGIVKRHHGRIEVVSTPGLGTTFHIHLPVRQEEESEVEEVTT